MLANRQRAVILTSIEKIHNAYVALDFFTTEKIAQQNKSLYDLALPHLNALNDNQRHQSISIQLGARHFAMDLNLQQDGTIACTVHEPTTLRQAQSFKKIQAYQQQDEKVDLICSHEINFSKDDSGKFAAGIVIRKNKDTHLVIGGAGKVDLYRDHLMVLSQVHQYLADGNDASMLIALTTGAGKTFVQALWLLVLNVSDVNGIFALPSRLIPQFKLDLKKLLPNEIANQALILSADAQIDNSSAITALHNMSISSEQPYFIIASYEALLDKYFAEVLQTKNTLISFDEQHLVVEQEVRKIKLLALSQHMMQMLLTATPDKETYNMCDRHPVAYLSNRDKEKAGHGRFPSIHLLKAKNHNDVAASLPGTVLTVVDKFYASVVDAIEPQRSSPAHTLLDSILNSDPMMYVLDPSNPKRDRWNYQPPLSRKSLTICYDSDELINLANFIANADEYGFQYPEVYSNGNLYSRHLVFKAMLLGKEDTDRKIENAARDAKKKSGYGQKYSVIQQLNNVVYSGIVDDLLSMVTGFSLIELNAKRKNNLLDLASLKTQLERLADDPQFVEKFQERLTYHSNGTEEQKRGIDKEGAIRIAKLMQAILRQLQLASKIKRRGINNSIFSQFITNSTLADNEIRDEILGNYDARVLFAEHIAQFRIVYLMEGLAESETRIADSVPFSGFTETLVKLRHSDMSANSAAKVRNHSIYEDMDVYMTESQFTPNYLNEKITETITDNYFKRGYIGMYVTNKKTEGFSDVNLHTEFSLVPTQADKNNEPRRVFQGFGRLRALDPTMLPLYFNAAGRDVQLSFDLRLLNCEGNYYDEFIAAQDNFNRWALPRMGHKLAKQIRQALHENLNVYDELSIEAYNDAVQLCVLNTFRTIYNNNSHDLDQSKKDLASVLNVVTKELREQAKKLATPYDMTGLFDAAGFILGKAYRVFHHFDSRCFIQKLDATLDRVNESSANSPAQQLQNNCSKLYGAIVKKSDFVWVQQSETNVLALMGLLAKKKTLIERNIRRGLLEKLKQNQAVYSRMNNDALRYLLPLLIKFVHPKKQSYCYEQAISYQNWLEIVVIDQELMEEFVRANTEKQAQLAIKILQKVPALRHKLEEGDAFSYSSDYAQSEQEKIRENIEDEIKGGVRNALTQYLQGDFLRNLQPFFVPVDYQMIVSILSDSSNAETYAAHLMKDGVDFKENGEFNPKKALKDFVEFFKIKYSAVAEVKDVSVHAKVALENISFINRDVQDKLNRQPSEVLSTQSYVEVARLLLPREISYLNKQCHDELLPGMVKFYEPSAQAFLLGRLSQFDKWPEVLFQLSDDIKTIDPRNPTKVFEKIFQAAGINKDLEGFRRDYEAVCKQAASNIAAELKDLSSPSNIMTSPLAITRGLWTSMFSDKTAQDSIGEQLLANYISTKLASKLEPFVYHDDHQTLTNLLADGELSLALSAFIIAKNKENASFNSLEDVIRLFKVFFAEYKNGEHNGFANNFKTAPDRLKQVGAILHEKANEYAVEIQSPDIDPIYFTCHPSYSAAVINAVNDPVKQQITEALKRLLPVLLCSVKSEYHQLVTVNFNASSKLPGIFAEMRDELTNMDADNVAEVTFRLLNRVEHLENLNVQEHGLEMNVCQAKLQDDLQKLQSIQPPYNSFAVNNLAAYIRNTLSKEIRTFISEGDWHILSAMLHSDVYSHQIAEKLIELIAGEDELTLDRLRAELKNLLSADPRYKQLNQDAAGLILFINHIGEKSQDLAKNIEREMKQLYRALTTAEKEAFFCQEMMAFLNMGALKSIVSNMAAHLSEDNLGTFLDVFDHVTVKPNLPPELRDFAKLGSDEFKQQFIKFIKWANKGEYEKIYAEFIQKDFVTQIDHFMDAKDLHLDLIVILVLLQKISEEQVLCHFHFFNANMSNKSSNLVRFTSPAFNQIRPDANQDMFVVAFNMLRMAALRRGMPLNSAISFATNNQLHGYLEATIEEAVTPLVAAIEKAPHVVEAVPSLLHEKALALGDQIRHLTSMSPEVIHNNDRVVDAIDPLINHVKADQKSWLANWWIARNYSVDLKDIDRQVQYCNINSNQSLKSVYDLATQHMKSDYFSDHFELVHQLRRRVYALMTLNTYKEQNKPEDYAGAVDSVVKYMEHVAQNPLSQHKFFSTTFNKIKTILSNDKLQSVDKLIRIQFLARNYRANTLHNIKRRISHFFSQEKYEEGVAVARFCEEVGKISLASSDGIDKMNSFLQVDGNNLANVMFNFK